MSYTEMLGRLIGDIKEVQVTDERIKQEQLKTETMKQGLEQNVLKTESMKKTLTEQDLRNELLKESLPYKIDAEYQRMRATELSNKYKEIELNAGYENFIKDKHELQRTQLIHANLKLKNQATLNTIQSYNLPMTLGMDSKTYEDGVKYHTVIEAPDAQRDITGIMQSENPDERFDAYIKEHTEKMQAEQYLYDKYTRAYEKSNNEEDLLKAQAAAHRLMKYNARLYVATDAREKYIKDIAMRQAQMQTRSLEKRTEYAKVAQGFMDDFETKVGSKKKEILNQMTAGSSGVYGNNIVLDAEDYAYAEKRAKLAVFREYADGNALPTTHPELIGYLKSMYNSKTGQQALATFFGIEDERSSISKRALDDAEETVVRQIMDGQVNIELPKEGSRLKNKAFRDQMFDVLKNQGYDVQAYIKRYNNMQKSVRQMSGNYDVRPKNSSKGSASLHRILREKALRTVQNSMGTINKDIDEVYDDVYEVYLRLCEREGVEPMATNATPTNIITVKDAKGSE